MISIVSNRRPDIRDIQVDNLNLLEKLYDLQKLAFESQLKFTFSHPFSVRTGREQDILNKLISRYRRRFDKYSGYKEYRFD